ncbi:MAG: hypothetical protein A3F24_02470 [Candidatus Colwellbacteria bacterium RIFCSPHIGHO2_12_FULL_44_17]|uniref:Uncharacterized protein n=2 Tax=Candidatus Colwelliibacteriota TaxID=1817904 RepID=A0A1G1ZB31_9BACT|nr:MAG: hypothetical protein A3F24_02470 [Candidatus Colwellbacteria bacterium RIFCSPHIGHO2_12_FULL_44_17]OGY60827.1 MAG: hypothetical protein A3I31_01465 [Candidatus Colwellbacteria bacterium RIFCSPLOWO2_02_FULL_44_20b]
MDNDIQKRFEENEKKLDLIYKSVEKTRKYFLWTLIITLIVVVLPAIALGFVIPAFLNSYLGNFSNLGL